MVDTSTSSGVHMDAASLFRAHGSYVAGFLARLGIKAADLDDLVQEVFLVAHRRGGFVDDGRAKATTWLAAIAIRKSSDSRRSQRRDRERSDTDTIAATSSDRLCPAKATEDRESMDRVQTALESLDTNARGVFVLFEIEGESCPDIARALEIPVGTVYSRLHQARRAFQTAYERLSRPSHKSSSNFDLHEAGVTP